MPPTLAHSPKEEGETGDPYARHVESVKTGAEARAGSMFRYFNDRDRIPALTEAIKYAATFHDLGKLDPDNQIVLRAGRGGFLRWDHIDAGVAHVSACRNWMAAWLIRAHHAPGLPEKAEHFDPDGIGRKLRGCRRDIAEQDRHEEQIARTNNGLVSYLESHRAVLGDDRINAMRPTHGLVMRLALSCLVDADHSDTAYYDTGYCPEPVTDPQWERRLHSLIKYVKHLSPGNSCAEESRNRVRQEFFEACLNSTTDAPMVTCEASVGLGKTTSVTAFLLQRAIQNNLRRLIIVAPFTNILSQIGKVLRKALVLDGENANHAIVEHHHRADFHHRSDRALAVLWQAPIVLTTAVSFFETLASCSPSSLRKLHSVPGSAIFLDEAHAALPTALWPQNWKWLCELACNWGCNFVFASGSLARFWENSEVINPTVTLPELVTEDITKKTRYAENRRIAYCPLNNGNVVDKNELIEKIKKYSGPNLVILNTVQNAAVIANMLKQEGLEVLHISTALAPKDREEVLKRVEERLANKHFQNWSLVATSCVEAGVDLSFRYAFRERFSVASLIQTGGRVNRNCEYEQSTIYDFALRGEGITQHPGARVSGNILRELITRGRLMDVNPADIVTEAMAEEINRFGGLSENSLVRAENTRNYPEVQRLGRVIDSDTKLVIVDDYLKDFVTNHEHISFVDLLRGSVQLWSSKVNTLGLSRAPCYKDIYVWNDDYDPGFLGYMSGVLRNQNFMRDNAAWII